MQLTKEQVQRFIEINSEVPEFNNYSDSENAEIASGVANYYLTLFKIYRKLEKEGSGTNPG
jgi:hypothetical protein